MSNKIAYLLIVFALSMIAGLACAELVLLLWQLRLGDSGIQEMSLGNRDTLAIQATLTPTPARMPTVPATPVPTPTITATPDPRVMLAKRQTLVKPGR